MLHAEENKQIQRFKFGNIENKERL